MCMARREGRLIVEMMNLGWKVFAVGVLMVGGCGRVPSQRAPGVPTTEPVIEPRPIQAPAADLTGSWYVGTGKEPEVASIVLHPGCAHNPAAWVIRQEGNAIEAWTFPESFNQGIVTASPGLARVMPARGTISGVEVTLEEAGSLIVLRYDSVSTHLRGTRDGREFWAVRQVVVRTETCPGIP
jgi:hypothetical protein